MSLHPKLVGTRSYQVQEFNVREPDSGSLSLVLSSSPERVGTVSGEDELPAVNKAAKRIVDPWLSG